MRTLKDMSTMPRISSAMRGWGGTITLIRITQEIIAGFPKDMEYPYSFKGIVQPLKPEQIALKPEGMRSWKWYMVHWYSNQCHLKTGDKIIYNNDKYKVMGIFDYSANGYVQYDIVEDFQ